MSPIGGAAKLTVDSQDQGVTNNVQCTSSGDTLGITFGSDYSVALTNANPPTVQTVNISDGTTPLSVGGANGGSAAVTQNGNTYSISGTAAGLDANSGSIVAKQFEADLTCP